ncbi:MAG: hypothetical protein LC708_01990, partial [Actinobacteria bacterium]|nr:hypothetical protein [Actinomycetota bacterium]
ALHELRRVLGRNGRLLLTVPVGRAEDHDDFVQREPSWWAQLARDAGFETFESELYAHDADGWHAADDVSSLQYSVDEARASGVLCAELRPRTLLGRLRGSR